MWVAMGVFAFLSLAAAISSTGFLEADACVHYMYSRFAFAEPHYLTNVWGRPWCTAIYAVPALVAKRMGVRVMSMLLALATAYFTMRIAKGQKHRWPVIALIFVLAQPIFFLHSFSELTELPFAVLVALGFWLYQRKQWPWMALVVGLMPTARPEGFGFLAMALVALILHRRAHWIPLLFAGLGVWSVAGWCQYGMPQPWFARIVWWVPEHWPYASESLYAKGPLLLIKRLEDGSWLCSFLLRLPAVTGPFIFPATLLGIWLSARVFKLRSVIVDFWKRDHLERCQLLIALIPLAIMAGHSYLWWQGKMASNGELRYLLVATPFWALLGASGWEWIFTRCRLKSAIGWAGIAALAPAIIFMLANKWWRVMPIELTREMKRAQQAAVWYGQTPYRLNYPRLMATHRGIYYFLDMSPSDKVWSAEWKREIVKAGPPGVILIWDPIYGVYNSDNNLSMQIEEIVEAGWIPVQVFEAELTDAEKSKFSQWAHKFERDQLKEWYLLLSPRDKDGNATPREIAVPIQPQPTTRP